LSAVLYNPLTKCQTPFCNLIKLLFWELPLSIAWCYDLTMRQTSNLIRNIEKFFFWRWLLPAVLYNPLTISQTPNLFCNIKNLLFRRLPPFIAWHYDLTMRQTSNLVRNIEKFLFWGGLLPMTLDNHLVIVFDASDFIDNVKFLFLFRKWLWRWLLSILSIFLINHLIIRIMQASYLVGYVEKLLFWRFFLLFSLLKIFF
jgi:hypothetical protein